MSTARKMIIETAKKYMGVTQYSRLHKHIIDVYNTVAPGGYKAHYSDAWCSEFASFCAIETFGKSIAKKYFPLTASCPRMVELAKKMGIWKENDAYIPKTGDFILYDWSDSGRGDNKNSPDHVGIVKKVTNGYIHVIEGNAGGSKVKQRNLPVNGRYIRGFVIPEYDKIKIKTKTNTEIAKEVIDGKWGNGTDRKKRLEAAGYNYYAVQKEVNKILKNK